MRAALIGCLAMTLAGCSSLWPFGDKSEERSRVPPNAAEYACEGGKKFYLRYLNGGEAAWVILPEREFRLDKAAGAGTRYVNGPAVLEVTGNTASLADGPGVSYTGCKTGRDS